ncbi:MAG: thiol-disulfide oxidoreductase [Flavobacteriales bacterium CG_4_9_14_3_um_filter_40_17]|nr:MAG: thiol-disulfide oxidoreductase [Flavobacteriales bacterium CG_4_9_14_3_um_filter_40_17]
MKIPKPNRSDLIFLGIILIFVFTPIGTFLKVQFNRLIAFSPSEIQASKREALTDYNWQLVGQDGQRFDLKQAKGKVILINYWATWCPPCIAEMHYLDGLYKDYKDKVIFLFISNEDASITRAFLNKKGYELTSTRPVSPPPKLLETNSLPTTYLIDKKGWIVIKKTGSADWNSENTRKMLDELLALKE